MTDEARGAVMVVYRRTAAGSLEYLVLHRAHSGPDYDGDWAWGPPSGQREPGESVVECAKRELMEETGLRLELLPCDAGTAAWPAYLAEAPPDVEITISPEHDRYRWVPFADAVALTTPDVVRVQVERAGRLLEAP